MLPPEWKRIRVMKLIVSKFTKPGDSVLDTFGGTFETSRAFLLLPKYRKLIGGASSSTCVAVAFHTTSIKIALQIFYPESDIECTHQVRQHVKVFIDAMARHTSIRWHNSWEVPAGLHTFQWFPQHIWNCFCTYAQDSTVLNCCRRFPLNIWGPRMHAIFHTSDANTLLSVECAALCVQVRTSTVQHPDAGMGVSADRKCGKA